MQRTRRVTPAVFPNSKVTQTQQNRMNTETDEEDEYDQQQKPWRLAVRIAVAVVAGFLLLVLLIPLNEVIAITILFG